MKTAYPAIIHDDKDGCWVEFPDLEGCFSDGESLPDAISNAADALGGYLCSLMDRKLPIPAPSNPRAVNPDDGLVTMIVTDPLNYKRSVKSVKKTLTIPDWLNEEAENRHINFSSVLQKALMAMIQ